MIDRTFASRIPEGARLHKRGCSTGLLPREPTHKAHEHDVRIPQLHPPACSDVCATLFPVDIRTEIPQVPGGFRYACMREREGGRETVRLSQPPTYESCSPCSNSSFFLRPQGQCERLLSILNLGTLSSALQEAQRPLQLHLRRFDSIPYEGGRKRRSRPPERPAARPSGRPATRPPSRRPAAPLPAPGRGPCLQACPRQRCRCRSS